MTLPRRALLSVSDKRDIAPFAASLALTSDVVLLVHFDTFVVR